MRELTPEEMALLKKMWAATIKAIYPDIDMVSRGSARSGATEIDGLLSNWPDNSRWRKPTVDEVKRAFLNTVLPQAQAAQGASDRMQARKAGARAQAGATTGLAHWAADDFIAHVQANVVTGLTPDMAEWVVAMTTLVVALRDEVFPEVDWQTPD